MFKANTKNRRVARPKLSGVARFIPIVINPTTQQLDKFELYYDKEKGVNYVSTKSPNAVFRNGKWSVRSSRWSSFETTYTEREGKAPLPAEYEQHDELPKETVQRAVVILYDVIRKTYHKKFFEWYQDTAVKDDILKESFVTERNFVYHRMFNRKKKNGELINIKELGLREKPADTGFGSYLGDKGTFEEFVDLLYNFFLTGGATDEKSGKSIADREVQLLTAFKFDEFIKGNFSHLNKMLSAWNNANGQEDQGVAGMYAIKVEKNGKVRQAITSIFYYLQLDTSGNLKIPYSMFNTAEILSNRYNKTFARNLAVVEPVGEATVVSEEQLVALKGSEKLDYKPQDKQEKEDAKAHNPNDPLDGITGSDGDITSNFGVF